MEEARSIEVRVMSCSGLSSSAFNFFQNLRVYVKVSIVNEEEEEEGKKQRYQLQKTPIDREGNGDPEWKHDMHFDLKQIWNSITTTTTLDNLFLEFDLLSEGLPILGDKTIGTVSVPLKELLIQEQGFNGGGATRFVSYQVKCPDGKPNGVLNFSYKVLFIAGGGGLWTKIGTEIPPINNNNNNNNNNNTNDDDLPVAYPPPASSNLYPKIDIHEPPPPIYYPPPTEIHHLHHQHQYHHHHHNPPPPPEVFCHAAPPPPLGNMGYHMPQEPVYPGPYEYGVGPVVSGHFPCPAAQVPPTHYGPSMWNTGGEQQRDISGGGGSGGDWSFRYRY